MEQPETGTPPLEKGLLHASPTLSDGKLQAPVQDFEQVKHFAARLQKFLMRNGKMQLLFPDSATATPVTSCGADLWQPVTLKALERVRHNWPPDTKALMSQLRQRREAVSWPRQRAFLYKGHRGGHLADLLLFTTQASSSKRLLKGWMLRLKALGRESPWLPLLIGSITQQEQLGHVKLAASGTKLPQGAPPSSRALRGFWAAEREPLEAMHSYRRKLKRHTLLLL